MAWIRLDVNSPRHPKVAGLSDAAFRLWITSLCHAGEWLTDGALSGADCVRLACDQHRNSRARIVRELVEAGLWIPVDNGYQIHDWAAYQTTKAQVEASRERVRERVRSFRARQDPSKRNAVGNGVTNGVGNALHITHNTNTPLPPRSRVGDCDPENPIHEACRDCGTSPRARQANTKALRAAVALGRNRRAQGMPESDLRSEAARLYRKEPELVQAAIKAFRDENTPNP